VAAIGIAIYSAYRFANKKSDDMTTE